MIKTEVINFFRFISPLFSTKKLILRSKQNLFLPFYHNVSDDEVVHIKNIYPVRNVKTFLNDIDFYKKNYTPVDINYIINDIPEKPVMHLSFDDGLREFYEIIAPVLLKKGIPASFFVNTDFIDNKDLFYRYKASIVIEKFKNTPNKKSIIGKINDELKLNIKNFAKTIKSINYINKDLIDKIAFFLEIDFSEYLQKYKPYLTSEQIKELTKKGFSVGSHSCSHPEYRLISLDKQIDETKKSLDIITKNFNPEHKLFSFPFTDYGVSNDFFDFIYKNKIADYTFGTAGIKQDEFANNFQRFPVDGTNLPIEKLVKAEYLYFLFKNLFNKNTIKR